VLGALDAARSGRAQWTVRVILDGEEEHGSPNLDAIVRAHRDRLRADLLIGSDGPKQKNEPTLVMGVRGLLGVDLVADNGKPASLHSGNYGNIVPNPVLPLARVIADIEERVRAHGETHDAFRREASELFAKWKDRAVWTPFLRPTVTVSAGCVATTVVAGDAFFPWWRVSSTAATIPPTAAISPEIEKTATRMKATLMPARRAASAFPPTA